MSILGVACVASGLVLLIWLYGPVHAKTLQSQPSAPYAGPPNLGTHGGNEGLA